MAFYNSKIKKVNSLNPTPPILGETAFNTSPIIFVPLSAIYDYKNASEWSNYTILTEKSVTINNVTAGGLVAAILIAGYSPLSSITHLTVTGNLNNIDFLQINTRMTSLTEIDMSGASIVNNILPDRVFQNKTLLTSIKLPLSLTDIGNSAFLDCTFLIGEILLPQSIVSIGDSAFMNCKNLTGTLTLPNNLNKVNNMSFSGCSGFSNLIISNSVTSIGKEAFSNCVGLSGDLVIPSSIISISDGAFLGCSGISGNLSIPNFVTSIGNSAFQECFSLTKITIGNSVNSISSNSFLNCRLVKEFFVQPDNQNFSSIDGVLFNKDKTSLLTYPCGKQGNYLIPSSVNSIGNRAFILCTGLTGISIPNSVTSIGYSAFAQCYGLSGELVIPNSITSIESGTFSWCSGLSGTLIIPNSVISIGDNAFSYCSGFTNLSISNSLRLIDIGAFLSCFGLTGSIVIPNSVTSIRYGAFWDCINITDLTISNSLKSIDSNVFLGCKNLTRFIIPESVTSIDANAFSNCVRLSYLVIPKTVTSIDETSFSNCIGLKKIIVQHKVPLTITANTFSAVDKESCFLEIPKGTSYSYLTTNYWSDFLLISENDYDFTTKIIDSNNSRLKVFKNQTDIVIEGTTKGEIIFLSLLSETLKIENA